MSTQVAAPDPDRTDVTYVVSAETTHVTGRRIAAFLVDLLLLNLIQVPLFALLYFALSPEAYQLASWVIPFVAMLGYFIVQEALWGRTVGKAAFRLRVVTLRGKPIDWNLAAGRAALVFVDGLFLGLPALISVATSPLRQRVGDRRTGTVVVRGMVASVSG